MTDTSLSPACLGELLTCGMYTNTQYSTVWWSLTYCAKGMLAAGNMVEPLSRLCGLCLQKEQILSKSIVWRKSGYSKLGLTMVDAESDIS